MFANRYTALIDACSLAGDYKTTSSQTQSPWTKPKVLKQ
jgi:hypothetical protein